MKLRHLFYELLAIPLLVPLVHNICYWNITFNTNESVKVWNFDYFCDSQFNCSSTINWSTYSWFVFEKPNQSLGDIFWNWNYFWYLFWYYANSNALSQLVVWWDTVLYTTSYNDSLSYNQYACDYLPNRWWITFSNWLIEYKDYPIVSITVPYANEIPWCLCFNYWDSIPSVCSFWNWYQQIWSWVDFWSTAPISFSKLSDVLVNYSTLSPFNWWAWWWWSSWWDLVELTSPYSVRDVLYAYWEMWYTNWLCYWNFALNDLAVSWTIDQFFDQDIEDGVYYTWANIFQLYNTYSWWYNFNTYMNSLLARFYPSYNNNTALWFIWLSKWLWYNQYLLYIHRSTIQDFSYQNLYNYCYFAIAIDQWSISLDDNFNKEMINKWSLPTSVEEELTDSNNSVLVPWEDSFFNWSWFVPWSWWAWWLWKSWSEWDEPSDAYWLFSRLYDYISWLSEDFDLWLTTKWVLPSVIQFWFLVALLYYILKR